MDILIGVIFLLFAIVQFNDPDGWMWFIYYLSVSIVAFYNETYSPILIKAMTFLTVVGVLLYLPDLYDWMMVGFPSITNEMSSDSPLTELVREAGGLLISFFVLLLYTKRMYKL